MSICKAAGVRLMLEKGATQIFYLFNNTSKRHGAVNKINQELVV